MMFPIMKRLLLFLLLTAFGTATAQRPAVCELEKIQDSIWRYVHTNRATDPVADAIYASSIDESVGRVDVHLILADSTMKARFRRFVHDSPLIRLAGFDPATTSYAPAPCGAPAPDELSLQTEYALYPSGTDRVRLTVRYRGSSVVYFGEDYTLCRFQHGRWEVLPVVNVWNSLLIGLGRPKPSDVADAAAAVPAGSCAYDFDAWLAPRLFPADYGRYRVCKKVYTLNPKRDYLLTAEFSVTPFVPFTRFTGNP